LKVHRTLIDGYRVLISQPLFNTSVSAAVGFEAKAMEQAALLDDLTLLARNRKSLSGGTAAYADGEYDISTDPQDPGYQTGSTGVSPDSGMPPPQYRESIGASGGFNQMHQYAAPPGVYSGGGSQAGGGGMEPGKQYVLALYDYQAQAEGDLSFKRDDKILLVEKTDNANDWWTGTLGGVTGVFPGTYVTLL
ncbi:hypothetical protein HDU76_010845, partial [Blyttiomyces sp. JEL0837]